MACHSSLQQAKTVGVDGGAHWGADRLVAAGRGPRCQRPRVIYQETVREVSLQRSAPPGTVHRTAGLAGTHGLGCRVLIANSACILQAVPQPAALPVNLMLGLAALQAPPF